ncbi:[protein-PII] uridylyltransferase [Rhodospirillum centenum]|uniref:Bifunctional uridylyltransferase/uridylyl-removing enzyme n=1 Tax=Rhodospirillum centenum (strain ATCC 51521 / SW) TaxID=414684 RepID=B6IU95_RHOCS|nr:[protein-PII] uridylyltransferase [Rhodospirillum centenum]ACI99972.1 protein-P-II uridylyltransferase [Rhodospirillum centenum SW]
MPDTLPAALADRPSPSDHGPRERSGVPGRAAIARRLSALVVTTGRPGEDNRGADSLRGAVLDVLKGALEEGRRAIRSRFEAGGRGDDCVRATARLADAIIQALADFAIHHAYPVAVATPGERFALAATGGYGRSELAPASDIDLLFLLPYKRTPRVEQLVEYMLYMLWDLGWKVGHAVRSADDCIRLSRDDVTIRTALLESRFLWGEAALFGEMKKRFAREVAANTASAFIEAKLAERDARHLKVNDSRYVLEPNLKEGKGGLRDLHTLFWIAKYAYQVDDVEDLVAQGVLLPEESQRFAKAQNFLWTARCHLHYLTGRQEDRLTFDVQAEIARRLGYTDHAGTSGAERFMKHYFLTAKDVGDLTRIFCANLEQESRRPPRFAFLRKAFSRSGGVEGFQVDAGRLNIRNERQFRDRPLDMIRLFHLAQATDLDIHPNALRAITRALSAIGPKLREDPEANRLFLEILTGEKDPEIILRRMSEAGVLARFVPDFGRIVALMQFDMYHTFTVDEHTLFALGILHRIESGALKDEVPLASEVIQTVSSRRALYVAMMLHDIAKGRGGDHSVLGAKVAEKLCPRLGMTEEETETVAWLVRWHLIMSSTAFKRDLDDEKTVRDFVALVQSPERLKLLLCLTVADIRAVGPGRWNGWKATLLRQLYWRAKEMMSGSVFDDGRERRVSGVQTALRAALSDWPAEAVETHLGHGYPHYWLAFDTETLARHARLMRQADAARAPLTLDTRVDRERGVTDLTVYTADHPGLFSRLAGALALAGATIVDARIFTMSNGMALDVFSVHAAHGGSFESPDKLARLAVLVEKALAGELRMADELAKRRSATLPSRARVFKVPPRVLVDNTASTAHTVVEVNGPDRPGLLYAVTRALTRLNLQIASAKVATYGNMAVDVFYVKDVFGLKVTHEAKLTQIRQALLDALADPDTDARTAKPPRRKAG